MSFDIMICAITKPSMYIPCCYFFFLFVASGKFSYYQNPMFCKDFLTEIPALPLFSFLLSPPSSPLFHFCRTHKEAHLWQGHKDSLSGERPVCSSFPSTQIQIWNRSCRRHFLHLAEMHALWGRICFPTGSLPDHREHWVPFHRHSFGVTNMKRLS